MNRNLVVGVACEPRLPSCGRICCVLPMLLSGAVAVHAHKRGRRAAGEAYDAIVDSATIKHGDAELIVFAHQDVLLPAGWVDRLWGAVGYLEKADPSCRAVMGVVGVNSAGEVLGRSWSNGLRRIAGHAVERPMAVVSLDELVIILRRSSRVRFDKDLPGFHLYGTDIVQNALAARCGVYVFDGPVVHNSVPVSRLGPSYAAAYRYMQRKWRHRLPIPTTVMAVTHWGLPLWHHRFASRKNSLLGRAVRAVSGIVIRHNWWRT